MRIMIWSGTLLLTFGALVPMVVADSLYRCSDGTFTNRVDRHCAPYDSKALGRVQPAPTRLMKEGNASRAGSQVSHESTQAGATRPPSQ